MSLSPSSPLTQTHTFAKPDPLRLRKSIVGSLSPTRQGPEKSPERSAEKLQVVLSPEHDDSPITRSPPAFRHRLLSESPDRPRREGPIDHSREVEDLKAKLRLLETKRIEDRRRIREFEAMKEAGGAFEKHKEKLQAKMTAMQEEIKSLRETLKRTETQLVELQNSVGESTEVLEMATLDREMAEERCEVLQLELDSLKERQEELVAENEYLKSENEEFIRGAGVGEGGERTAGSLQLERQNERLKEALVRLRDITGDREAELKSEISALTEEIEQLTVIKGIYCRTSADLRSLRCCIATISAIRSPHRGPETATRHRHVRRRSPRRTHGPKPRPNRAHRRNAHHNRRPGIPSRTERRIRRKSPCTRT
jgi:hypothetical protein